MEISENEVRKDFSKAERIEYARKLERIEAAKARERQGTRTDLISDPNIVENFPESKQGQVRDVVASKLGIGSGKQYEREKFISDNRAQLTPEDFTDWDEGKLSTNKAYQRIKAKLQEAERRANVAEQEKENLEQTLQEKEQQHAQELANVPEAQTVIKYPEDYDSLKRYEQETRQKYERMEANLRAKNDELMELKAYVRERESQLQTPEQQIEQQLQDDALFFCARCDSFLKATGGLAYLADRIDKLESRDKKAYKEAVQKVLQSVAPITAWAQNILNCIE